MKILWVVNSMHTVYFIKVEYNKFIMIQLFKKDRKYWTQAQEEQAEYFLQCNEFFSKFYQRSYLQDILQLAYYTKITSETPLYLTDNKRPAAIILLKGNISVYKRLNNQQRRRKRKSESEQPKPEFVKMTECLRYNQTIIQSSQCKIACLHCQQAQLIFVPSFLYNKHLQKCKQQKDKVTFNILNKIFKKVQPKFIMDLARSGCKIKDLKINHYIYEEGQKPESVFVIIQGSAKLQRPGFSPRKNLQLVIVSTQTLLGDKDLCYNKRQSSAICCSSHIKLLQIPKEAFLKFTKENVPELQMMEKSQGSRSFQKSRRSPEKKQQDNKLPMIMRLRSAKRSEQQSLRQYNLIKNSHVLLEATNPSKKKIRSRSSVSEYPKNLMQQKIKLYKKLRPIESKLDLSHRII